MRERKKQILILILWYLFGLSIILLLNKIGDSYSLFEGYVKTPLGTRPKGIFGVLFYGICTVWAMGLLLFLKKLIKNEYVMMLIFLLLLLSIYWKLIHSLLF